MDKRRNIVKGLLTSLLICLFLFIVLFFTSYARKKTVNTGALTIGTFASNLEYKLNGEEIDLTNKGSGYFETTQYLTQGTYTITATYKGSVVYTESVYLKSGGLVDIFVESDDQKFIDATEFDDEED